MNVRAASIIVGATAAIYSLSATAQIADFNEQYGPRLEILSPPITTSEFGPVQPKEMLPLSLRRELNKDALSPCKVPEAFPTLCAADAAGEL